MASMLGHKPTLLRAAMLLETNQVRDDNEDKRLSSFLKTPSYRFLVKEETFRGHMLSFLLAEVKCLRAWGVNPQANSYWPAVINGDVDISNLLDERDSAHQSYEFIRKLCDSPLIVEPTTFNYVKPQD